MKKHTPTQTMVSRIVRAIHCDTLMILLTAVALCCVGCDDPTSSEQSETLDNAEATDLATTKVSARIDPDMQAETVAAKPSPDQDQAESSQPIPEDLNFFAFPEEAPRAKEVVLERQEDESVRLLGFINLNPADPNGNRALLKVGDTIFPVAAGETMQGITLVSISGRAVTLQRDRDRWTLAMFDQAVVNKPSRASNSPIRKGSAVSKSGPLDPTMSTISTTPSLPLPTDSPTPPWMPPEPQLPTMPPIPPLPNDDLGLPDIELPHLDGLPENLR